MVVVVVVVVGGERGALQNITLDQKGGGSGKSLNMIT
jgi:hypothetical protein